MALHGPPLPCRGGEGGTSSLCRGSPPPLLRLLRLLRYGVEWLTKLGCVAATPSEASQGFFLLRKKKKKCGTPLRTPYSYSYSYRKGTVPLLIFFLLRKKKLKQGTRKAYPSPPPIYLVILFPSLYWVWRFILETRGLSRPALILIPQRLEL